MYLSTYLATLFFPTYLHILTYLLTYLVTSSLSIYLFAYLPTYLATFLHKYPLRNKIITNWCLFRYRSLCKYVPGKTIRPTSVSGGKATNSGIHQNVAERRLLHRQLNVFIKILLGFFAIRSDGQRFSINNLFLL